jgi:hypothetical protein
MILEQFSTQFRVHDWMNLMASDDSLWAIRNCSWTSPLYFFLDSFLWGWITFSPKTPSDEREAPNNSPRKHINQTSRSELVHSESGNLTAPRQNIFIKIKFTSPPFVSSCVWVKLFSTRFASSRAYKSNQHENNAAPSDTTHIKQSSISRFRWRGCCNFDGAGSGKFCAIDSENERKATKAFFSERKI